MLLAITSLAHLRGILKTKHSADQVVEDYVKASDIVDYNLKLHKKLRKARRKMVNGGVMVGERGKKKDGKRPPPDSGYKDGLKFYKMPPPNPPRK